MATVCKLDFCDKSGRITRGLCKGHYAQLLKGKPLTPLIYQVEPEHRQGQPCTAPDCDRLIIARKLCRAHYEQMMRGSEISAIRPIGAKGAGTISSDGYRKLFRPGHPNAAGKGTIYEHRLVMSEVLGRPLLDHENVHHINGDRLDNRPENLELWSTSQPKGQRVAEKVAWARSMLDLYGDLY